MNSNDTIPDRLYKYRAFSNRTLDMVVSDKLHFADPSTFNDPLDARAYVKVDVAEDVLEKVLRALVEQRVAAEMRAAAKTMQVGRGRAETHIRRASHRAADERISDIEYNATNPDYRDAVTGKFALLRSNINRELLRQYDRGIVSLSERVDCPLMWSHYGDQHRGICIGYSVPRDAVDSVRRVRYGGSRSIKVSKVAEMLKGDGVARREVDEAMLLRKAEDWRYEQEWRLLGARGLNDSTLELEEVVFGMRCEASVKYAVMKALEGRDGHVGFRESREQPDSFDLKMDDLNYNDELFVHFPNRHRSIFEAFEVVLESDESAD